MAALVGNHHRKDRKFGELPGLNNPRQRRAKPAREGVETIIDPPHRGDGIVQTTNGENRRRKTKWDVIRVSLDRSQHRAPSQNRICMSFLNISVPPFEAYIRAEFLRNGEDSHGVKLPCMVFGMSSIPGNAPCFHFMMEDGGMWWRMPVHAFCWKDDAPDQELDELVLWDSFSYHVGVTQFAMLKNKKVQFISRRREKYRGTYMFTLDWAHEDETMTNLGLSEYPSHHKCGHFIRMDNGNFAIQPNNRLTVHDPSFCTKPDQLVIHRKYCSTQWSAERNWRWVTPDTDIMDYDHTDLEKGESNETRSEMYNASDAPLVADEDKV